MTLRRRHWADAGRDPARREVEAGLRGVERGEDGARAGVVVAAEALRGEAHGDAREVASRHRQRREQRRRDGVGDVGGSSGARAATADLHDAKRFADAIHAAYPDKMLAYNLSPSFNWDSTGMRMELVR